MKPIRRRGQRGQRPTLALTERDFEILTFLGLVRFATTTQLAREFFPSLDRARRRVRSLFDAKLVAVTLVAGSTSPNIVSLTPDGVLEVGIHDPEVKPRLRCGGSLRISALPHHVGLVDCRLWLSGLASVLDLELVLWSSPGGPLHAEVARLHLEPDGIAELIVPDDRRLLVAVEFCTGSEAGTILRTKFEKYHVAFSTELLDELLFVAVGGRRRLEAVDTLLAATGIESRTILLPHEATLTRPIHPTTLLTAPLTGVQSAAGSRTLTRLQHLASRFLSSPVFGVGGRDRPSANDRGRGGQ